MSLTQRITERAEQLGFQRVGFAPADPLPHGEEFRRWLDLGFEGEMKWMERSRAIRDAPEHLLSGVRTLVAVAVSYKTEEPTQAPGQIARYARGYDYHRVMEHKLEALAAFIRAEVGADARTRVAVDRLPLLERDVAWLAGIGWYGKNTLLLNRTHGSYLFLGELLVDSDLGAPIAQPHRNFCGSCTACLDVCPTGALVAPYQLDARRCIAYLTIELRGSIPRALRRGVGDWLFGCDLCQEVCPWNRRAPNTQEFAYLGRPEIQALSADRVLTLSEHDLHLLLQLSPVQRPQRAGLARNAAVVLGNTGDRRWVPLLTERLQEEMDAIVRGHIAWALGELAGPDARAALERQLTLEDDPGVLDELQQALLCLTSASS